jgi:hypothetical protein
MGFPPRLAAAQTYVIDPAGVDYGLNLNETTLPQLLKQYGGYQVSGGRVHRSCTRERDWCPGGGAAGMRLGAPTDPPFTSIVLPIPTRPRRRTRSANGARPVEGSAARVHTRRRESRAPRPHHTRPPDPACSRHLTAPRDPSTALLIQLTPLQALGS